MMNYTANTTTWQKGDLVLHDADAKEPKMLMIVIGYTRDGQCKTQYLFKDRRRTIWKNDIKYLHDPEQWIHKVQRMGIANWDQKYLQRLQSDFMMVKRWNRLYEIGQRVITTSADGGFETVTKGKARFENGHAHIYLAKTSDNRGGNWSLQFVEAVQP